MWTMWNRNQKWYGELYELCSWSNVIEWLLKQATDTDKYLNHWIFIQYRTWRRQVNASSQMTAAIQKWIPHPSACGCVWNEPLRKRPPVYPLHWLLAEDVIGMSAQITVRGTWMPIINDPNNFALLVWKQYHATWRGWSNLLTKL